MSGIILQGVTSALFNLGIGKITEKLDQNSKNTQIVKVKNDPDTFSSSILDFAETVSTKWNVKDNPDLEFINVHESESIVKEISIIPNNNFKNHGQCIITIDDVEVFQTGKAGAFKDVLDLIIKINKTIQQDSKVKLFLISDDGTKVKITAMVVFGE